MPRSKDPRDYGQLYYNLSILMDAGEQRIALKMTHKQAKRQMFTFYAYRRAWAHQIDVLAKRKGIEEGEKQRQLDHALRMDEVLRNYAMVIEPDDESVAQVELVFINRDLLPEIQPLLAQVSDLVEKTEAIERVQERREVTAQLTKGGFGLAKPVDTSKWRDPSSPMYEFFKDVDKDKPQVEGPIMTEAEILAEQAQLAEPTQVSLDDLVPIIDTKVPEIPGIPDTEETAPSTAGTSPKSSLFEQAMRGANALRKKEKEG